MNYPIGADALADAETIKKAAERATALTRRLLTLSHKQVFNKTTISPNAVILEIEQMFRRLMGEGTHVRLELASDDPKVKMDQAQFEQILMNLFVNAKDAMPNGGVLTVRTSSKEVPITYHHALGSTIEAGKYAEISVIDTGEGMTEDIQKRIFEPFFTTKGLGKGTGLGLATVFAVTRQNNGYIEVDSAPNQGSTFRIYLPLSESTVNFSHEAQQMLTDLSGRQKTILLVEDDVDMRRPVAKLLKEKGFLVLEAENGNVAVKVFTDYVGSISLIISDVIMPEMSGPAMLQMIRSTERGKDLRVLFLSGYSSDELAIHGISRESAEFLEKPFNAKKFLNKLQEMLGS